MLRCVGASDDRVARGNQPTPCISDGSLPNAQYSSSQKRFPLYCLADPGSQEASRQGVSDACSSNHGIWIP